VAVTSVLLSTILQALRPSFQGNIDSHVLNLLAQPRVELTSNTGLGLDAIGQSGCGGNGTADKDWKLRMYVILTKHETSVSGLGISNR